MQQEVSATPLILGQWQRNTPLSLQSKFSQKSARIQSKYSLVPSRAVPQKCVQMLLWAHCDPHLWQLSVTLVSGLSLVAVSDPWFWFITVVSLHRPLSCLCKTPWEMCRAFAAHHISQSPAGEGGTRQEEETSTDEDGCWQISLRNLICFIFSSYRTNYFALVGRDFMKESRKDSVDLKYPYKYRYIYRKRLDWW